MKRTFLLSGVGAAMLFATLATATSGRMEQLMAPETTSAQPIAAASAATLPTAGESIGTVDAILYADSGLDLEDFNAEYVARTSDNTYLGFAITSIWVTDPERVMTREWNAHHWPTSNPPMRQSPFLTA